MRQKDKGSRAYKWYVVKGKDEKSSENIDENLGEK